MEVLNTDGSSPRHPRQDAISSLHLDLEILQGIYQIIQSGRSGLAKHGGAYFSAIYGSIEDPIAVPGPYENQEV